MTCSVWQMPQSAKCFAILLTYLIEAIVSLLINVQCFLSSKSYKWFCNDCAAIIFYYKYRFCIYPVTYTFWHSLTCITLCCKNENMPWIFIIHNTTVFFGGNLQCWKGGVFWWSIFLFTISSIQRSLLEFRKQKKIDENNLQLGVSSLGKYNKVWPF